MGTKDSSAQARMLREPNLTLTKAIDMCRSSEQTQIQIKKIGREQVHYTSRAQNSESSHRYASRESEPRAKKGAKQHNVASDNKQRRD